MRAARRLIGEGRQRLVQARLSVQQRQAALHTSLKRGLWSSRLSVVAFVGSALLPVLPHLDGSITLLASDRADAVPATPLTAEVRSVRATEERAPVKLPGSLAGSLLDEPRRAAPATGASTPPWRVVPTRRMDLTGHVVDSTDPIRIAGKQAAAEAVRKPVADDKPLPVPPATAPVEQQADAWTDAEVAEARAECAQLLTGLTLDGEEAAPVRNGACGTPAPVTVKRAGGAMTELSPPALLNCRMAARLNEWINGTLQPASQASYGQPVVRIVTASSYVCRNRYGQAQAPISEHAFANALDMSAFVLRDGRVVRVVEGWGPTARDAAAAQQSADSSAQPASEKPTGDATAADKGQAAQSAKKAETKNGKTPRSGSALATPVDTEATRKASRSADEKFLHALHKGACGQFGTVLGPEANAAHRDHIHIDLKQRKHTIICQ